MEEKKNKLIDLKGANSTMKLGLVLYAAIVVALIVGACHAYAAGDPISTVNKLSEFIFKSDWTHTARTGHHAGRTLSQVPRSVAESQWVPDCGGRHRDHIYERNFEYDRRIKSTLNLY